MWPTGLSDNCGDGPPKAEARRLGLPVTAYVGNLTVWDEAIRAGVTGINHVTIYRQMKDLRQVVLVVKDGRVVFRR